MFHADLRRFIHQYVRSVYRVTKLFPRDELYGLTSQFRRATVSVELNYCEGYARQWKLVMKQFYEIAYGSLKESQCVIQLAAEEGYLPLAEAKQLNVSAEQIGAMLWGILCRL